MDAVALRRVRRDVRARLGHVVTRWVRTRLLARCGGPCGELIVRDTVCLEIHLADVSRALLRCPACALKGYGPAPFLVEPPPVREPLLPREPPEWVRLNRERLPQKHEPARADYRQRQAGD